MIYALAIILAAAILVYAMISMPKRGRGTVRRASDPFGFAQGRRGVDRELVKTRWNNIIMMADMGGGSGLRNAVSEADKLLDYVMRESGASGETMADRLRSYEKRFSNINAVWRAHKLRNSLAHDIGFDLVASQAKEAIADFERGLRDLGAL